MKILTAGPIQDVLDAEKYREPREQYMTRKREEGYNIYMPNPNELCLDLDTEEAYQTFLTRFERMSEEITEFLGYIGKPPTYKVFNSTTPEHRHVIVKMPFDIKMNQRIALQAVLGSDPVRELMSIFRVWNGDRCPTLLAMLKKEG